MQSWNEPAFRQAVHIQLQPLLAARASDVHSRPVGNGRSQAHKIQMVPRADWGKAKLKALVSAVPINWQLEKRLSNLPNTCFSPKHEESGAQLPIKSCKNASLCLMDHITRNLIMATEAQYWNETVDPSQGQQMK